MLCETAGDSEGMSCSTVCGGVGVFAEEEFQRSGGHWQRQMAACLGRVPAPLQNLVSGLIKAGTAHNIS